MLVTDALDESRGVPGAGSVQDVNTLARRRYERFAATWGALVKGMPARQSG